MPTHGRRTRHADGRGHTGRLPVDGHDGGRLVAEDLNLLYCCGEHGNVAAKRRYQTVFDRAEALG